MQKNISQLEQQYQTPNEEDTAQLIKHSLKEDIAYRKSEIQEKNDNKNQLMDKMITKSNLIKSAILIGFGTMGLQEHHPIQKDKLENWLITPENKEQIHGLIDQCKNGQEQVQQNVNVLVDRMSDKISESVTEIDKQQMKISLLGKQIQDSIKVSEELKIIKQQQYHDQTDEEEQKYNSFAYFKKDQQEIQNKFQILISLTENDNPQEIFEFDDSQKCQFNLDIEEKKQLFIYINKKNQQNTEENQHFLSKTIQINTLFSKLKTENFKLNKKIKSFEKVVIVDDKKYVLFLVFEFGFDSDSKQILLSKLGNELTQLQQSLQLKINEKKQNLQQLLAPFSKYIYYDSNQKGLVIGNKEITGLCDQICNKCTIF